MPKPVHDCVNKLLSKDDFYPGKSQEDRESAAWGICYKNYNKKHEKAEVLKSVDEVTSALEAQGLWKEATLLHKVFMRIAES